MSLRSDIGKVRGLGSAKEGVHHWWMQRLTAIALIPLVLWFVAEIAGLAGADLNAVRSWIASPVVAVLLVLLIGVWTWQRGRIGELIGDHHQPRAVVTEEAAVSRLKTHALSARV